MTGLRVSLATPKHRALVLPTDVAVGTQAVLATKGAGKSNAAVVLAEEMYDRGIPWVAVDPKGDWYGIRSSADGKGPGLPVVVFGGRHGDVPLEPTAGALIAELVLEQRLTCVLDVSQFTKADTIRFLLAFGRYLFAHADDDGADVLHLFLEEAHEYLPQVVKGDQADLVNVWQRIVKQGRFKGLGVTLISQRSSVLNKDVLELIDTLIVLRTMGPRSRASIKDWVHDQDVDDGLLASLPGLGDGEAWIWSPGALKLMERIQFRQRRTYDSGATPKIGAPRRPPATLADIDLADIKERMAETIERAKADDPKELRRRIAQLEKDLANRPVTEPEVVERVVETIPEWLPTALGELRAAQRWFEDRLSAMTDDATSARSFLDEKIGDVLDGIDAHIAEGPWVSAIEDLRRSGLPIAPIEHHRSTAPRVPVAPRPHVEPPEGIGKCAGALLTVLAARADGTRTRKQLALQAGYSPKKSTVRNGLSELRTAGYIEGSDPIRITADGRRAAGDVEPLPTGWDLIEFWRGEIGGAALAVFDEVAKCGVITKAEAAVAADTDPAKSTIRNALSQLRGLGLIVTTGDTITLSPELQEGL